MSFSNKFTFTVLPHTKFDAFQEYVSVARKCSSSARGHIM